MSEPIDERVIRALIDTYRCGNETGRYNAVAAQLGLPLKYVDEQETKLLKILERAEKIRCNSFLIIEIVLSLKLLMSCES